MVSEALFRRERVAIVVLPIIFLFITVFVTREDVRWLFGLGALLLIVEALLVKHVRFDHTKSFAVALLALAAIGLSAASILTIEKIELLKNPERVTSCSFSPVVACSPVITSPQASAFDHIPNPVFGIFGFSALLTAAMTILAGAVKLHRTWWLTLFGGVIFGVCFCIWLFYQGVYEIGALCLYCLSVWLVTGALFWMSLSELVRQKIISPKHRVSQFIVKERNMLITVTIGVIILLLYFRWSDYWNGLF